MAVRAPSYLKWLNALVLLGFGWLAILLELAPLNEGAGAFPAPDLLFCVCAFLAIRRPAATPGFLIVLLGLARDLVSGGPVGLGALTLLGAVEVLRAIGDQMRRRAFVFEFAAIVGLAVLMVVAQVAILIIAFAPAPPIDQLGLRALGTVLAYISVYVFFRWVLRIRGEVEDDRRLVKRPAA